MKKKKNYEKSNSEYIIEQRTEGMTKEDVSKYYQRRLNIWALAVLLFFFLWYLTTLLGLYSFTKATTNNYDALQERTDLFGKQICSDINEQYFGYWVRNGNVQVTCENNTVTFMKQD